MVEDNICEDIDSYIEDFEKKRTKRQIDDFFFMRLGKLIKIMIKEKLKDRENHYVKHLKECEDELEITRKDIKSSLEKFKDSMENLIQNRGMRSIVDLNKDISDFYKKSKEEIYFNIRLRISSELTSKFLRENIEEFLKKVISGSNLKGKKDLFEILNEKDHIIKKRNDLIKNINNLKKGVRGINRILKNHEIEYDSKQKKFIEDIFNEKVKEMRNCSICCNSYSFDDEKSNVMGMMYCYEKRIDLNFTDNHMICYDCYKKNEENCTVCKTNRRIPRKTNFVRYFN